MYQSRTLDHADFGNYYGTVFPGNYVIASSYSVSGRNEAYPDVSWIVNSFDQLLSLSAYYYGRAVGDTFYRKTVTDPSTSHNGSEVFTSTESKRPVFNDCTHLKHTYFNKSMGMLDFKTDSYNRTYISFVPHWRDSKAIVAPNYNKNNVVHMGLGDLDAARSRAWWTMQPRCQGGISMLNFLFELKDFRDILKYGLKIHKQSPWKNLKDADNALGKAMKDPTLPAAASHLTNEFAIKPLVKDWGDICKQLYDSVEEVQEQFYQDGKQVQKTHYTEVMAEQDNLSGTSSMNRATAYIGTTTKTSFTATLEYKYDYSMRAQHAAFLQYWGLTGSFEAFWNMIPGSFIVDYFVKIGKALHAMETDPNVNILSQQYCESLLTEHIDGIHVDFSPFDHAHLDHKNVSGYGITGTSGYRSTNYNRVRCKPRQGLYVPVVKLPNNKQRLNMLALARTFLS